ncbi:MAG: ABC transporter ATP-binding protein [Acidimicrobiaceae bacterium]|nr:ABC transporter ATP-binding protein [Acidimicrobiaceae bacterium]
MARIEMQGLVKTYGTDTVVDNIDLTVEEGEFVVLLGPSGCGKTSTLRMVAGLESITSGQLRFDGELMNAEPPDRRSVGMVFQNYALYPHMSVRGNLSFGLQSRSGQGSRRKAKADVNRRVKEMAELLELEHVIDHRPKELSGGQRQRVALGRALIREPRVFLLDEPLSNLDANLRDRMRTELSELHDRVAITTIYVTHDQSEALTLADRLVVMHQGKIRQVGKPSEVYTSPADTFVASFIGSPGMNLWPRQWTTNERGEPSLGESIQLPHSLVSSLGARGTDVTVGVRPEHLHLINDVDSESATVWCRVNMVEHLGSHLLVHASLSSDSESSVLAQVGTDVSLKKGDEILLGARTEHVSIFDSASGLRMEHLAERVPA